SPVGAAGGVLVEGAGAPDVGTAAMDLGVIDGRDVVAVPEPSGGPLDQPGQAPGDSVGVPGAVLGEGFQGLPVGRAFQGPDGLGDGVFLDIEGQGGDPLGEAAVSASAEAAGEGGEPGLPEGPEERSFRHGESPGAGPNGIGTTWQVPSRRRLFQ